MKNKTTTLLIALSVIFLSTIGLLCIPTEQQVETITDVIAETPVDVPTPTVVSSDPSKETPSETKEPETKPVASSKPAAANKIELPKGDYPEAQLIWDTMLSWGWSPETCAGIIGNMMAEIGGGTLDLSDWDSNGGCGYGLIQWTDGRRSTIKNRYGSCPNIQDQLTFMKDELFGTNNTTQQVSSNNLSIIMNSSGDETPESVAYCFASYYERCNSAYRARRRGYARIAYEYFMNK